MAIIADKEGFLIGEPVTIDTGKFSRAAAIWRDIREDTAAIRRALVDGARLTQMQAAQSKAMTRRIERQVAEPASRRGLVLPMRDARGRFISSRIVAGESRVSTPRGARSMPSVESAPTETQKSAQQQAPQATRDSRGRFLRRGPNGELLPQDESPNPKEPKNPKDRDDDDEESGGFFRRSLKAFASSTGNAATEFASGSESIDPTIAAAKEATGLVAPIVKPFGAMFGAAFGRRSERKKQKDAAKENAKEQHKLALPWYKRLAGKREPASVGAQSGGMLGMLAAALPMIGGLLTGAIPLLIAGAGILVAGGVGAWLGTKIGGWINDKFGTQIADAIDGTAAFVKNTWQSVTGAWDSVTKKAGEWIDRVSEIWGTAKRLPSSVREGVSNKVDQVQGWFGGGSAGRKAAFEKSLDAAGITNPTERAMMMAQAHHETGGFRNMSESFAYTPEQLRRTSSRARSMDPAQLAAVMKSGETGIAELMYGGRLGNTSQGDAFKYRGRGYSQLTGKANYAAAGAALGLDLVNNPDLAADPQIAGRISAWYHQSRGLGQAARAGDVLAVTRGINGGTNGLAERQELFKHYSKASGVVASGTISRPSRAFSGSQSVSPLIARQGSAGMAVPNIDKYSPGKAPEFLSPIGSRAPAPTPVQVTVPLPVTQNVADRGIAQLATGGMGGGSQ